jgi:hypothetical protein
MGAGRASSMSTMCHDAAGSACCVLLLGIIIHYFVETGSWCDERRQRRLVTLARPFDFDVHDRPLFLLPVLKVTISVGPPQRT